MSKNAAKNPRHQPRPAADPRVVAVFQATATGFRGLIAKRATGGGGLETLATRDFATGEAGATAWVTDNLAARTIVVLSSGSVIARAVQMPRAPEDKLISALDLNTTTFVLGRTPAHRVATSLLPGERGTDRLRTGLMVEWPEDQDSPPLPAGMTESAAITFAPEVAALAALVGVGDEPFVAVDAEHGAVTVAAPTTKGVLVRIVRAGREEGGVDASEIARAVGEACVHAGVPTAEMNIAIERTREAANAAIDGGFGCTSAALPELGAAVRTGSIGDRAEWWSTYGVLAGTALAALGPCTALTRLHSQDLGARPGRVAGVLNRLAEPRTRMRVMVAALALIAFGPMAFQGLRLLVLQWKLPNIEEYEQAERADDQKRVLYRMLQRNSASMTKTMSDIAATAPEGIDIDFVGISPTVKGQAVTLRGRARAVGSKSGTDALLQFEDLMRTSGMFEGITRSSEPPNQAGSQDFSIGAIATHPTDIARYPAERDPAVTSWRIIRYGLPPADTDWAAEGLTGPDDPSLAAGGRGAGAVLASGAGSAGAASTAGSASGAGAASASGADDEDVVAAAGTRTPPTRTIPTARTTGAGTAPSARGGPAATAGSAAGATAGAGAGAAPGATPVATPASTEPAEETRAGGRPAPGGSSSGGLARRGSALGGSSTEPEPPPAPISEAEINALTKAEAHERLNIVARARNRADLEDDVKARLRVEFDALLERCKRE